MLNKPMLTPAGATFASVLKERPSSALQREGAPLGDKAIDTSYEKYTS